MALFDCSKINLKQNSKGDNVKKLQEALHKLGYYNKAIDGSYGYYTKTAVKSFQSAYKLSVDGVFGPKSCAKLNAVMDSKNTSTNTTTSPRTGTTYSFDCPKINLKFGSSGEEVKKLQTMLHELGYYHDIISGNFKTNTEKAVKEFQRDTDHTPDGVFGPKTCPDLNEKYAQKKNSKTSPVVPPDDTPLHLQKQTVILTVHPDVVVLPEQEVNTETQTKTSTGGSIQTDTNFDCSKVNLKKGSSGDDVKKLQTILKARGYYTRQIDGDYGKYTVIAVKKLQTAQGNTPDGEFGPKTCSKLQVTSSTSNTATGTADKKNKDYIINDIFTCTVSTDMSGLSDEITITFPYTVDRYNRIRKLQKTTLKLYKGKSVVKEHKGYIKEVKTTHSDDKYTIELNIMGYIVFLEQNVEFGEKTAKRSDLLKELVKLAGLKLNLDTTGLKDDEYTIKVQKATTGNTTSSGSGGLTEVHGTDCESGAMQTNRLSARSFDINACGGNTKIGDSSANYAQDTKNMSAKEAILDVYNRFKYGPSLTSSAVYNDNRRCPKTMWTKTGKIYGNCADISRLIKCVGEVHGLKVGIRHCPSHYYNLIEVNGKTYRFDCCFRSGVTGAKYGGEICNNLTKRGGPWS